MKKPVIAIDGASGTGKSTISKRLASSHDLNYIDTGAIYRSIALLVDRRKIELVEGSEELRNLCMGLELRFEFKNGENRVFLSSEDVSQEIRSPEISMLASRVSALKVVRDTLLSIQRRLAEETQKLATVADGRDMGTVIFPYSPLKIFLKASDKVRAKRRYDELIEKGMSVDPDRIFEETVKRDRQDSTRSIAPLRKAEDAIEIDTDGLSIDEVLAKIEKLIADKGFLK